MYDRVLFSVVSGGTYFLGGDRLYRVQSEDEK
jgi:hypothetical protein